MNRNDRRRARRAAPSFVRLREVICGRCGKSTPADNAPGWNFTLRKGAVIGATCPGCQTPEENAEAEINLATTDYDTDAFGRVIGRPKVGGAR